MTLPTIATALQSALQSGQIILGDRAIDGFDLTDILSILNSSPLMLTEATLTSLDNTVMLSGKARIFGTDPVGVNLIFTANGEAVDLSVMTIVPVGSIPGVPWLPIANLQMALTVSGGQVTGTIQGSLLPKTGEAIAIVLSLDVGETVTWRSELQSLSLTTVADLFLNTNQGPQDLPNFVFSTLALTVSPGSGEFALNAQVDSEWAFTSQGLNVQVDLGVSRLASQVNAALAVRGAGPLEIAPDLSLQDCDFTFNLEAGEWMLAGTVAATILDESLQLSASYVQGAERRLFMLALAIDGTLELVNLPEVGRLGIANLAMTLAQSTTGEPANWSLAAAGHLQLENVLNVQGLLTLSREDRTTRLVFMPDAAEAVIPLPPNQEASLRLQFGEITIARQTLAAQPQRSAWAFETAVDLAFAGWHPSVYRVLPPQIQAQFRADRDRVMIIADRAVNAAEFEIPDIEINNLTIPLGTMQVDVVNLAVRIDSNIEVSADLALGLPSDLNNLFGVDSNRNPNLEFFNTFDPRNPEETTVNLRLAIGTAGISVTPVTSPIRAVRIEEDNGIAYWHVDLGRFGEVRLQVPVFSYDTAQSSFMASGGFEVIRPLSLPLTPFKRLLEAAGLGAVAATIPDGLPFQDIQILDDNDNFRSQELRQLLATIGDVPTEITDALDLIGDRVNQLPSQFRDYLNVEIPDSFTFAISVTPSGTAKINARVNEGDDPIRLLYPSFQVNPLLPIPVPVLNGIELRSLSFGELSGGSLFLLEVDANLDQFDLITLAASLALPDDDAIPLPNTRDLQRRLVLRNLFMIIVYQTVIPIPIPLFYDEVGIEYLGLEGLTLQTHAQFPMPSFDLGEVSRILADLRRFFTDRDFLLNPNTPPDNVNLRFSLDSNYLRLPEYLGSQMLGPGVDGPDIDLYANLAHLLNGLKTLSLNELIQALPLEYRVGGVDVSFVSLRSQLGWLVTTPGEFQQLIARADSRDRIFRQLQLTDEAQAQGLLSILPAAAAAAPTPEEGLVTFLKGTWTVANVAELEAAFGLVASGSQGFRTGFRIAGEIDRFLELEVAGRVAINAPLAGAAALPATEELRFGLSYDGQDDWVQLGNPAGLNFDGPITIEAWVRPATVNGLRNIVAHGHRVSPNGEVFLRVNNGRYEVGSWDGRNYLTSAPIPPEDIGAWVHLAGVYDGQNWRLYRNGVQISFTQGDRGAIAIPDANWAIGARGTGTERFFQGQIDEVRLWNRAKTAVEIQADRNRSLSGREAGLVGYWSFDEGTGTIARDRSPNGHNGTVNGAQWLATGAPLVFANPDAPDLNLPVGNRAFQLAGHSHLSILNHRIFTGDVQVVDTNFWLRGDLNLFPAGSPLQANGRLAGVLNGSELNLSGHVTTSLAGLTLADARGLITNNQVFLQGSWLGVTTTLAVTVQNNDFAVMGAVNVDVPLNLNIGPIHDPITGVRLVDGMNLNTRFNAGITVGMTSAGFSAQVGGSFQWNNRTWQLPGFTVTVAFQTIEDLARHIAAQIQAQAAAIFRELLSDATAWLRAVREGVIQFAGDVAVVLRDGYRLAAQAAAQALQTAGYTLQQVGQALQGAYRQTAAQAAQILQNIRDGAQEIATVLQGVYRQTAQQTAQILRDLRTNLQEVGRVLQRVYNQTAQQAAQILRDLGYAVLDVGTVLRDVYRQTAQQAAQVFRNLGTRAEEVGRVLQSTYSQSSNAAASILRSIGYGVQDIGRTLQNVYSLSATSTAQVLRAVGYSVQEVGQVLQGVYRQSAEVTARTLRSIGYGAEDVGRVLQTVYSQSAQDAGRLLQRIGFSRSDVERVLRNVFNQSTSAIRDFFGDVGDTIGDVFRRIF
ncbi:LamG-like jellyroll fold domain-containing protein [Alkalinema pantanalense CENA528]|uniref:LamG domain-containing protein n=1 Tax=Alkalinema pantanalense TaxID=1620705 RepID=UPI003D6FF6B8